jgi:hypothetical protein
MTLRAIDHIQLAMPHGGEDAARAFYDGLLGVPEAAKPADMAARGGCWFEQPGLKIHLGVEADFKPSRKAHPAFPPGAISTVACASTSRIHSAIGSS